MQKLCIFILVQIFIISLAHASTDRMEPRKMKWPFDGAFGTIDREAAQRGYKIYKEVCSTCHSLNLVSYRNLTEIGFSEAEVKALAAQHQVRDGPNDEGEMFNRPGNPADHFIDPFANEKAARAANNGAYPPNLSLIIKAREDGANYVYSLLTGYQTPPKNVTVPDGMYYNPYFPNHNIAMPPPLSDGLVTFDDGSASNIDALARDIVIFLQWAAEPDMEKRKRMGIKTVLYLLAMTGLFYFAKKIVWKNIK